MNKGKTGYIIATAALTGLSMLWAYAECFNDRTFKIPSNKKIRNLKQKKIEKLMVTEIYFPILPYGYISGIPPPR